MSLVVSDLTKRFRDVTAVDGLSFIVREGVLFASCTWGGKDHHYAHYFGHSQARCRNRYLERRPSTAWALVFTATFLRGLYPKMRAAEHLSF